MNSDCSVLRIADGRRAVVTNQFGLIKFRVKAEMHLNLLIHDFYWLGCLETAKF